MKDTVPQQPTSVSQQIDTEPIQSPKEPKSNKSRFRVALIGVLLLIGLLTGGYFLATQNKQVATTINTDRTKSTAPTQTIVTSSPFPTTSRTSNAQIASLSSMTGWKIETLDSLQIKLPPSATIKPGTCDGDLTDCYLIEKHDSSLLSPPHITIKVKPYGGGSRRQEADFELPLEDYTFIDKTFGTHKGLEAINNCKTSQCTSLRHIVIVVDNKLIKITDGIYKKDSSTTLESIVTNSIISTIGK